MAEKEALQEELGLKDIISYAKEYGFVFPSSEIYDGLQAVYDYGPYGSELRNNLKEIWWKSMTQLHENVVGIDSAIFMHPTVWKASGHVDSFNDPMIDNLDSKKRYRADVLLEDKAAEYENNGDKKRADELLKETGHLLEEENFEAVKLLIERENITCPISGTCNWTEVRQFNLMFDTKVGSVADDSNTIYLRPETAQGIFVNFLNVQKSARMKVPFGIAQTGKAFRNEIVARQFIFRMREFEQMEMQFFVAPGEELKWYEHWKEVRMKWHKALGIPEDHLRYHDHEKLAHYANAASDIEYKYPFGWKELEGIHSRTDFDLKRHEEYSKKKQQYFDPRPEYNKNYVPFVIETSIGLDRLFLMTLANAIIEEEVDGKQRKYLKLNPVLAPIKAAILPLTKKDGLPEVGRKIFDELKFDFKLIYDENQSIGKRYVKQDLIGTPFCIAIDYESLEDNCVTIRHRDTMEQERVAISALKDILEEKTSLKNLLGKL